MEQELNKFFVLDKNRTNSTGVEEAKKVKTEIENGEIKFSEATPEQQQITEIFSTETPDDVMHQMSDLAETLAIDDDRIKRLDSELRALKAKAEVDKETMHRLMMANNCANGHKFDNGINLRPKVKTDVFKSKAVEDEVLFAWLRENNLGAIIKEAVNWQTLSSTMKEFMDAGNKLPEILNLVQKQTVHFVGNGKAKFLAARERVS